MAIIETEIWKANPDRPGTIIFDSSRVAQDVFSDLEAHLTSIGRMPDEYFNLWMDWKNGELFPKDATLACEVNFGGSEGIYLDISIEYKKDMYEYSRETGELGWHNRTVIERFATGKTLGESNDDLDRMNLIASSVTAAFYGYEDGVHARYAAVKHNDPEKTAKTIYGEVKSGDWVIAAPPDEYAYLLGVVTEIVKLGTPEHAAETSNETDNIHIDFTAFEYPPERITEIEERFSGLYGEPKAFEELPLDDVIMAPDMLISISNLSQGEITRLGNLLANCESFCNCFIHPQRGDVKFDTLAGRIEKNLSDYQNALSGYSKQEIIDMAGKICAMSDAHSYLTTYHRYSDDELDFFLQFQNPLDIVADVWCEHRSGFDDMSIIMGHINDRRNDFYYGYPVVSNAGALLPKTLTHSEKPGQAAMSPLPLQKKSQDAGEKTKPPSAKKQSITAQLAIAGAEAKEYNAQRAQNQPATTVKHKKEID